MGDFHLIHVYHNQFVRDNPKEFGIGLESYGNAEKKDSSSQCQVRYYRMDQEYLGNHV